MTADPELARLQALGKPMGNRLTALGFCVVWCNQVQDGHYLACLDNPCAVCEDWLQVLAAGLTGFTVKERSNGTAYFENVIAIKEIGK